jgi:outer membrane protein assembly factor BamA
LLLRLWGAIVERTGSTPVPFDELVSPAGTRGMRGFADGRFRGPSGMVGSAEYRWLVARELDASIFVDVGGVADRGFTKMSRDNLYPSIGVGLRWFSPGAYYWRASVEDGLQLAYSREGGIRLLLSTAAF